MTGSPASRVRTFHDLAEITEQEIAVEPDSPAVLGAATGTLQAAEEPPAVAVLPLAHEGPAVAAGEGVRLVDALARRRTSRTSPDVSLPAELLGWLLEHAARAGDDGRRPHPSAGALYPLRVDVVALRCAGVAAGVYRYDPHAHGLRAIDQDDHAVDVRTAFGRGWVGRARAVLVLSADLADDAGHHGVRGYRYALLEAGHLAQNLLLLAAAAGVPACPLGGFADDTLRRIVRDEDDLAVLYAVAL